MSNLPRKRLRKLEKEEAVSPRTDFIPKKAGYNKPEVSSRHKDEDEYDSMDDFITDRVEFDRRQDPLSSSESSAHSTDEEGSHRRKPRRRRVEPREVKSSDEEAPRETVKKHSQQKLPKSQLVGKKALEAKRAQGLIPSKARKEAKKDGKEVAKKEATKKEPVKKEQTKRETTRKSEGSKKYSQYSEFDSEADRKKAKLVTRILIRWWYVLDPWPPADQSYTPALLSHNLRVVLPENWSVEPTTDSQGLQKVLAVPGYPGLFKNNIGKIFDLRPQDSAPSFDNLFRRSSADLKQLLLQALESQLTQLEAQPKTDALLKKQLLQEIEVLKSKGSK